MTLKSYVNILRSLNLCIELKFQNVWLKSYKQSMRISSLDIHGLYLISLASGV
jgi:hypothetical protein